MLKGGYDGRHGLVRGPNLLPKQGIWRFAKDGVE